MLVSRCCRQESWIDDRGHGASYYYCTGCGLACELMEIKEPDEPTT